MKSCLNRFQLSVLGIPIAIASTVASTVSVSPVVAQTAPPPIQIAQATSCSVTNIRTGQLAVRFTPNGRSRAGLNNGNTVTILRRGNGPWVYVRVTNGPNRQVNGTEGWVNSNYLDCGDIDNQETGEVSSLLCDVINIRTGQLAVRFTPNGRSRAGLNNGNVVQILQNGTPPWTYVRVVDGPNRQVNGTEGWVNSNYLNCYAR